MLKNVKIIAKKLESINKKLYIVGGFCRDEILGVENSETDIDLTTDALPSEIMQVLNVVGEVGKKYGTSIIKEASEVFEITTFRQDILIYKQ